MYMYAYVDVYVYAYVDVCRWEGILREWGKGLIDWYKNLN
jgi:hypothetical protein